MYRYPNLQLYIGLAYSLLAGEPLINTTFAVILGDNFFYPKTFIKELIEYHKKIGADASICAFEVVDVTRHGIILPKGNHELCMMLFAFKNIKSCSIRIESIKRMIRGNAVVVFDNLSRANLLNYLSKKIRKYRID